MATNPNRQPAGTPAGGQFAPGSHPESTLTLDGLEPEPTGGSLDAPNVREGSDTGLAHLADFAAEHGHCRVPYDHVSPDGFRLGRWASNCRHERKFGKLSPERIAALDAAGFAWEAQSEAHWQAALAALAEYKSANGHCRVPNRYVAPGGFRLGSWANDVRKRRKSGDLSDDKAAQLDVLGFSWAPFDDGWRSGLAALAEYKSANGHCRVPYDHVSPDGFRLGQWVAVRRHERKTSKLSPERISALDAAGFAWEIRDDLNQAAWDAGLAALAEYKSANGHRRVPRRYVSPRAPVKSGRELG